MTRILVLHAEGLITEQLRRILEGEGYEVHLAHDGMEGLSAIFGVIMATSDCPVMEFLKPMARFHLPFATIEETTVRTASMYLLAQYFKNKNRPEIKSDFKVLEKHYSRVQRVNEGLLARIHSVSSEDADKNAIVTLHSLSQFLPMEIDYSLSGLEYIFAGRYME